MHNRSSLRSVGSAPGSAKGHRIPWSLHSPANLSLQITNPTRYPFHFNSSSMFHIWQHTLWFEIISELSLVRHLGLNVVKMSTDLSSIVRTVQHMWPNYRSHWPCKGMKGGSLGKTLAPFTPAFSVIGS